MSFTGLIFKQSRGPMGWSGGPLVRGLGVGRSGKSQALGPPLLQQPILTEQLHFCFKRFQSKEGLEKPLIWLNSLL